jgi:predicted DNA-binding protein
MTAKKSGARHKLRLIKVPVQAYLEPEQAAELKALSERTRVPQQAYLREGVEYVLQFHRERLPDGQGNLHTAKLVKRTKK